MSIEKRLKRGEYSAFLGNWFADGKLYTESGGKTAACCIKYVYSRDWETEIALLKIVTVTEQIGIYESLPEDAKPVYQAETEQKCAIFEEALSFWKERQPHSNLLLQDWGFVDWQEEHRYGRDLLVRLAVNGKGSEAKSAGAELDVGKRMPGEAEVMSLLLYRLCDPKQEEGFRTADELQAALEKLTEKGSYNERAGQTPEKENGKAAETWISSAAEPVRGRVQCGKTAPQGNKQGMREEHRQQAQHAQKRKRRILSVLCSVVVLLAAGLAFWQWDWIAELDGHSGIEVGQESDVDEKETAETEAEQAVDSESEETESQTAEESEVVVTESETDASVDIESVLAAVDQAFATGNSTAITEALGQAFGTWDRAKENGNLEAAAELELSAAQNWLQDIRNALSAYDYAVPEVQISGGIELQMGSDLKQELRTCGKVIGMSAAAGEQMDSDELENAIADVFLDYYGVCEANRGNSWEYGLGYLLNELYQSVFSVYSLDLAGHELVNAALYRFFDSCEMEFLETYTFSLSLVNDHSASNPPQEESLFAQASVYLGSREDTSSRLAELYAVVQDAAVRQDLDALEAVAKNLLCEGEDGNYHYNGLYPEGAYYYCDGAVQNPGMSGDDVMILGSYGRIYYGSVKNGLRDGESGVMISRTYWNDPPYLYIGNWSDNAPNGQGTVYKYKSSGDRVRISGTFTDGLEDGKMSICYGWTENETYTAADYTADNGVRTALQDDTENPGLMIYALNNDGSVVWGEESLDGTFGVLGFSDHS